VTPLIGETNSSIVLETLAEKPGADRCGREATNRKRARCSEIEIDSKLTRSMPNIIRFYADAVLAVAMLTLSVIAAFPAAAGHANNYRRRDGRIVPSQARHYLNSRLAADAEANQSRRDRHLLEAALWFTMLAECRGG